MRIYYITILMRIHNNIYENITTHEYITTLDEYCNIHHEYYNNS